MLFLFYFYFAPLMLIKIQQASFLEHVDLKLFFTFLLISTDSGKNETIFTDTFESIDKENRQKLRED